MTVLANNTVLSNFAATGQVSLLFELYGEVYVADRAARQYAKKQSIKIGGTIGALGLLVKRKFVTVDDANDLLALMISKARYRTPYIDISRLLEDTP